MMDVREFFRIRHIIENDDVPCPSCGAEWIPMETENCREMKHSDNCEYNTEWKEIQPFLY